MRTTLNAIFVAVLVQSVAAASLQANEPATRSAVESHVYKEVEGGKLELFVHKPAGNAPDEGWPAIVFFYGGAWVSGDINQFKTHSEHLAQRGMVAIRAHYRVKGRFDNATPFDCMVDARSAIRWVRAHAEDLSIDSNRIAAAGGSAGGHIALCTATITDTRPETDADASARPNALVLFNPVVDPTVGTVSRRFDGRAEDASPMHHLAAGTPPTLIIHGSADETVPIETIKTYQRKVQHNGDRCDVAIFDGRGHGFFNFNRKGDDPQDALDRADAFLTSLGWLAPRLNATSESNRPTGSGGRE